MERFNQRMHYSEYGKIIKCRKNNFINVKCQFKDLWEIDGGVKIKIMDGLKIYLTDWKNLLTYGIVGLILLYCLLFAPIAWYWRVVLLLLVIAFNIVRMKYFKK